MKTQADRDSAPGISTPNLREAAAYPVLILPDLL